MVSASSEVNALVLGYQPFRSKDLHQSVSTIDPRSQKRVVLFNANLQYLRKAFPDTNWLSSSPYVAAIVTSIPTVPWLPDDQRKEKLLSRYDSETIFSRTWLP